MRVVAMAVLAGLVGAQAPTDEEVRWRILTEVRAALAPALPFPPSDAAGVEPADSSATSPWMLRPPDRSRGSIEVVANPLNADQQSRATAAMIEIAATVDAAQRRSQAQYERAVDEARRTGRSQDVEGVTLADEGVAGARIDSESRLIVEVEHDRPAYRFAVASGVAPAPGEGAVQAAAGVVRVPANVYRDRFEARTDDRYCEAEALVFFGTGPPGVDRRSAHLFEVTAVPSAGRPSGGVASFVVRLRGNETLIAEVLRGAEWSRVAALVGR